MPKIHACALNFRTCGARPTHFVQVLTMGSDTVFALASTTGLLFQRIFHEPAGVTFTNKHVYICSGSNEEGSPVSSNGVKIKQVSWFECGWDKKKGHRKM